ncbi:enoyl-CoA hydratase/isomerase family protein [Micromonospora zingiberis]|uniref:Enoyl-CoA hydratase/isomerase family protein n=1 Tax=Micromonospora zingiberis TaxID=2053011 RepID=A0A4R0GK62_9ACTN|nr:enoyl-CoA hydratase/isomerase family protein [Micromonospora zingiberis]TCB97217.1 enoyl-CoA hydratase/isomerase family protein [Micromonospora zingiberis]
MITTSVDNWCGVIEAADYGPLSRHEAPFARALRQAVVDLSDDDHVKVIVLRTTHGDFAGAGTPPPVDTTEVLTTWHRDFAASSAVYQAVCFSKKVVVTEVAGHCSAAGSMLVLCSDLTVAAENATFASPFTDLPEANFVLAALTMRLNRAKSWLLRGSTMPAAEAVSVGLVNQVVPADELAATTRELARSVTGMPLDGITMSKMLLQAVLDGHGVGREFDLADHYAIHRWAGLNAGTVQG